MTLVYILGLTNDKFFIGRTNEVNSIIELQQEVQQEVNPIVGINMETETITYPQVISNCRFKLCFNCGNNGHCYDECPMHNNK
jgi:hypothetical protein